MSDNKNILKKEDKQFGGQALYYSTIAFVVVLIIANAYGVYFAINTFTQITSGTTNNVPADSSLAVPALNTNLYSKISTERKTRTLYTNTSTVTHYNFPEIFNQPQTKTNN